MGGFEHRAGDKDNDKDKDVAISPNVIAAFTEGDPIVGNGVGVNAHAAGHVAPELDPGKTAGKQLGATYVDDAKAQYIHEHPTKAQSSKLWDSVPLDSREDRLKVMGGVTQSDKDQCAGTSVVMAALYGGGSQGIASLVEQIKKSHAGEKDFNSSGMDEILANAKAGKTSPSDITQMQIMVQQEMVQLQDKMLADPKSDFTPEARQKLKDATQNGEETTGINPLVLQTFISQNPDLAKEFKDKGMGIKMIDPNGKGDPAHYVLDIQDGSNPRMIYDPAMKKSGGQVITDSKQLGLYDHTHSLGQEIKPKDLAPPPAPVTTTPVTPTPVTPTPAAKGKEFHWYNPFTWF